MNSKKKNETQENKAGPSGHDPGTESQEHGKLTL